MKKKEIFLALSLIGFIVLARLLPHLPNVAPVAAAALVAGVYIGRKWALLVPMIGMLVSDLFIGFYSPWVMLSVYGSFVLIGLTSWLLRKNKNYVNIVTASLAASILFFFITNFAVWIGSAWYTHDWVGFVYAFELAIPFFRNTMIGDLAYVGVLFFCFELISNWTKNKAFFEKMISQTR